SGGNNLITALRKVEVSDSCYNTVIQKANDWLKEKTVFENIYAKHQVVMVQYAKEYNLSLVNNSPVLNNEFYKNFQQSKINIKNQWASHPTREDRETHLEGLHIEGVTDNRPAWMLFSHSQELQKEVTASLYKTVPAEMQQQSINDEIFRERYLADTDIYHLPAEYNGYYDNRLMNDMDIEKLFGTPENAVVSKYEFEKLFSEDKTGLLKSVQANQQDAKILEAIIDNRIDIKTFDYDGEKMKKDAAAGILEKLKMEIEQQQQQVQQQEERIVSFFCAAARLNGSADEQALKNIYLLYTENKKGVDEHTAICHRIVDLLSPLLAGQTITLQAAADMASGLRKESNNLRPLLINWIEKAVFDHNTALKEKAMKFSGVNYQYFASDSFFDNELKHLNELVNESMHDLTIFQFRNFKKILEYQLEEYHKQVK
ncbi:MAG: hypothetical protein ABUT20_49335, partial [Bacteroidota bacterium]